MATEPDPYRTLGLPPTASLAEVKAAYRRLAKANHPDAAGEAALPRFLSIQAAYERLVGPAPGGPRPSKGSAPARKPWEADPDRSDATHRAYGGRTRRPAGEGRRTGPNARQGGRAAGGPATGPGRAGAAGPSGQAAGSTGEAPGSTGPDAASSDASSDPGAPPKKATLGSTSYDGVGRETFEPDWGGASWYGTSSGTYWTINPKEYADPRKHGPEYQARARRAARAARGVLVDADGPAEVGADAPAGSSGPAGPDATVPGAVPPDATPPDPTPRHTTSSWWEATSGPTTGGDARPDASQASRPSTREPRPAPRPAPPRTVASDAPGLGDALGAAARPLTAGSPPSAWWRVARAAIGWLPIALAIGWASGEVTGCARFSAGCDASTAPVVWILQVVVFGLLVAFPAIAGLAVIGALASLVVAIPATLFVTATAGAAASSSGTAFLGVVLGLAWLIGIVGAVAMRRRASSEPVGPVS